MKADEEGVDAACTAGPSFTLEEDEGERTEVRDRSQETRSPMAAHAGAAAHDCRASEKTSSLTLSWCFLNALHHTAKSAVRPAQRTTLGSRVLLPRVHMPSIPPSRSRSATIGSISVARRAGT